MFCPVLTSGSVDPLGVSLSNQFFWARIRGLPPKLMNDDIGKTIGEALGVFLRTGKDRQGSCLGSFLRIRVGIDVGLPLIKGVAFKPEGWPESKLLDVDYEHLPHFCFFLWSTVSHWKFLSDTKRG